MFELTLNATRQAPCGTQGHGKAMSYQAKCNSFDLSTGAYMNSSARAQQQHNASYAALSCVIAVQINAKDLERGTHFDGYH